MSVQTNPTRDVQDAAEILIAEDSPTQAEKLRYILERQRYRVTLARDGKQALASLNVYKPALVISDIVMPEMNGYELCQRIKAGERTRDIPVILLTTLSDMEDVFEGLACGADSFITKPYSEDYLLAHIEKFLANRLLHRSESARVGVEIHLAGKSRVITADPQQMLNLLLSTYEAAVHRNTDLIEAQDELSSFNERLEDLVEERTAALLAEIAEREHLQMELHALSLQDELTGLHNRRGFMTLAEQHWRLALRTRQEFTLLYMDMDDLKRINDTFGHAQGDQALRDVARILEQTFRDSDILARMGGDEFTVLFTDCDLASARAAINRLYENLLQINANASRLYNLSLSVGMAHFNASNQASINDLLEQADAEMYVHKQQRRKGAGG
jgi:two-component system cell cycle response regulator